MKKLLFYGLPVCIIVAVLYAFKTNMVPADFVVDSCIQNKRTDAVLVIRRVGQDRIYAEAVTIPYDPSVKDPSLTLVIDRMALADYEKVLCPSL